MTQPEKINKILLEFNLISREEIIELASDIPWKIIRWLAASHPDNRTRKYLLRMTNIEIGSGTVINANFIVSDDYNKLLTIGQRVAISPNVTIVCASGPNNSKLAEHPYVAKNLLVSKPVIIEDDVWIGTNVVVLPGVKIGQGSIVGAGSVVAKSVEPFSICTGNPAKKIRDISNENI